MQNGIIWEYNVVKSLSRHDLIVPSLTLPIFLILKEVYCLIKYYCQYKILESKAMISNMFYCVTVLVSVAGTTHILNGSALT